VTERNDESASLSVRSSTLAAADRNIAASRSDLVSALDEAKGALREITGRRSLAGWTAPLVAAGLGLVAAIAIRRFVGR
jgi:hypothetical protein